MDVGIGVSGSLGFKEAENALSLHTGAKVSASQIRAVAQGIGSEITEWSSIRDEF